MKTMWIPAALLILWPAVSIAASEGAEKAGPSDASKGVRLIKDEHKIRVEINGRHFADYNYGVEAGAPSVTQFFDPLNAPDGTEIAADQYARKKAQLPGADHPHQRALRFSHLHGNLSRDYWHQARHHHVRFTKVEGDTVTEELEWEGGPKAPKPELREQREFRFFAFPDGARGMDVSLTYRPGAGAPSKIGPMGWAGQNDLIFALMVIRVAPELGGSGVVTLASGKTIDTKRGVNEPLEIWKAPWIDISGTIQGKTYGIAFIAHPQNAHPTVWRRDYLYWGIQANIEANRGITLEEGQALTLRYRVVVHQGDAASAGLEEKARELRKTEKSPRE
jgi:hypothetical protein